MNSPHAMSRRLQVGGNQGRGDPLAARRAPGHADVLLAAHLWNETPGLRLRDGHRLLPAVRFVAEGIARRCWRFTGPAA